MVETLPDGDVLIGDPELDMMEELENAEFDQNIAETIDERELGRKAQELIGFFENDKEARTVALTKAKMNAQLAVCLS
jgi:hypothetical protein